jgi:hypothetical protein
MLAELKRRFASISEEASEREGGEEVLIADNRARLSPAQLVDQKLRTVLSNGQFVASALHTWKRPAQPR